MKMLGSCSKSKCTFHPPHMVKLTLSEKPTDMSTWPFAGWSVTNGGKKSTSMKTKLKFEITGGMATVTAKYKVA